MAGPPAHRGAPRFTTCPGGTSVRVAERFDEIIDETAHFRREEFAMRIHGIAGRPAVHDPPGGAASVRVAERLDEIIDETAHFRREEFAM